MSQKGISALKIIRLAAWSLLALVFAATGYVIWSGPRTDPAATAQLPLGGPFRLTDTNGQIQTEALLAGRPYAIFFGYTHCPDICPTTLADLSRHMADLGPDAAKIAFVFVTVDPERDTPDLMKNYISSFAGQFVGLSGTREETDRIIREYRIYARKVPTHDNEYNMDHTAGVFLFDAKGEFRGVINGQEADRDALAKLRRLLG